MKKTVKQWGIWELKEKGIARRMLFWLPGQKRKISFKEYINTYVHPTDR